MERCNRVTTKRASNSRLVAALAALCCGCSLLAPPSCFATVQDELHNSDSKPRREISGPPNAPTISVIDSPTAQCYGPLPETNVCYVQWSYIQVFASSSQYIERLTVTIDGRVRAYYGGFFQNWMAVPAGMQPGGFKVVCGFAGVSGDPDYGYQYPYVVRARETGGLSAANYGTVQCPADHRLLFRNSFE